MFSFIERVPLPLGGVALGLAALGNLLQPWSETAHALCGIASALFLILVIAKAVLFSRHVGEELHNSILASVSATSFMALMQLAGYLAPWVFEPALALWIVAVTCHLALMAWFTAHFITRFSLDEVFPTYFICYVGIVVASVTSPGFGLQEIGRFLLVLGGMAYALLIVVVTWRYLRLPVPKSAEPLFCIYAAPMSLSLAGYLSVVSEPNPLLVSMMLVAAQGLFLIVVVRLPHLLTLPFYPSYAAMTFPFVITATALGKAFACLRTQGVPISPALDGLPLAETALATAMVLYVSARYVWFLAQQPNQVPSPAIRTRP